MIGFNVELKYPNHKKNAIMYGLNSESVYADNNMAIIKNGSQHITKAPVMIARVLAAFLSRLESAESLDFLLVG